MHGIQFILYQLPEEEGKVQVVDGLQVFCSKTKSDNLNQQTTTERL